MNRGLTLYFHSELEVELFPVDGRTLVGYWDALREARILAEIQEVNELAEGGCYDSL